MSVPIRTEPIQTEKQSQQGAGKARILIVDDEPAVLSALSRALHRDFEVLTAADGAEALRLITGQEVPIMVTDQRMPGMTGAQLLAAVADVSPLTIGILITGYNDIAAVIEAINVGRAFRYHPKPWNTVELVGSLHAALDHYQVERQRREELERLKHHLEEMIAQKAAQLNAQNARLLELEQLKNRFLTNVSHQLRTPLAIMRTSLELLRMGKPEKQARYLENVTQAAQTLETMILSTLDFSEFNLGPNPLTLQPVAIGPLVEQIVRSHRLAAQDKNIHLILESDLPGDLLLLLDAGLMRKALDGILVNALRFTPAQGVVRVSVAQQAEGHPPSIGITVRDSGPGMTKQEIEHLFEPFFRGREAQDDPTPGLGLGLALADVIVRWHGGAIEVTSAEGQGSVFQVRLAL